MDRTVECPSGLTGAVTHLRAADAGILADQRAVRSGRAVNTILSKCWTATEDKGPYSFQGNVPDWRGALACDRIWALLMIRIATYGEIEELDMRCPECGHRFVWDLPLLQLPYRPLPQASRDAIATGKNRFETTVTVDGEALRVWFRLLTGADQEKALKEVNAGEADFITTALRQRVLEVEGVAPPDLTAWFNGLSMGAVQELIDRLDEHDGGIDTAFDVYCPKCTLEWEVDLPLDLTRMFAVRKANPRRRARRAALAQKAQTTE